VKKSNIKTPRKPPQRVNLQLEPLPQVERRQAPRPQEPLVVDENSLEARLADMPLHELLAAQGVPI
jgi:hypothetical protein